MGLVPQTCQVARPDATGEDSGNPRPPELIEALRRANVGKKLSAATRAKMSAAHKALRDVTTSSEATY